MQSRAVFRAFVGASVLSLAFPRLAHAGTFTVSNVDDSGAGSFRQAVIDANAAAGPHTIDVTAKGVVDLVGALPTLTKAVVINGPGAESFRLLRKPTRKEFALLSSNADLEVHGIAFEGGKNSSFGGACIDASGGAFTLEDSLVTGCTASGAFAVSSSAVTSIRRSRFTANTGYGVLYLVSQGATTIVDTTIDANTATPIVFPPANGVLTIERSLVTGNTNKQGVAGLQVQGGTARVLSSTFSGNAGGQGGDFWTYSDGITLELVNVTSFGSSSPALLADHAATVKLTNTVLAGSGDRCKVDRMTITSLGHNAGSDATCGLTAAGDKPSTDAKLGDLADNGGPTKTHLPAAGSPLLDAGIASSGMLDQRGRPRVAGGAPDIGAVEAQAPDAPAIGTATPDGAIAFTAPAFFGDAPIAAYDARCTPGDLGATGATSPLTVLGLVAGTTYTCAVTATNAYGTSPASASVEVSVPVVDAGADAASSDASSDAGAPPVASVPDAGPGPTSDAGGLVLPIAANGEDDDGCSTTSSPESSRPVFGIGVAVALGVALRRRKRR